MINKKFESVIKIVCKLLEESGIKWSLIGSTNMALQGIDINPNDIDIVVHLKYLDKVRNIFSNYSPSLIKELKPLINKPGWEIKFKIQGIEIQILGEKDEGVYVNRLLASKLIKIKIGKFEVPCFSLETESRIYHETNRKNKAKIIDKFLEQIT